MAVRIKRVYEDPEAADGYRVLVDRVWPRGVSKEHAHCDEWLREVGPSKELRTWFRHDPGRFEEFERRYRKELESSEAFEALREIVRTRDTVTLVYSAKDDAHNQAVVLSRLL